MNSNYIKTALLHWLRFSRQIYIVATEVGEYNSDVLYAKGEDLVEIEVKTSLADFKMDFKKAKHKEFFEGRNIWAPNLFCFAVPPELVDKSLELLKDTPYGLYKVIEAFNVNNVLIPWQHRVTTVKRPQKLHNRVCSGLVKQVIIKRLSSELCNLRSKA